MSMLFPRLPRLLSRRLARLLPRWNGNHVRPEQVYVRRAAALKPSTPPPSLLPWGFLSQSLIQERVAPLRQLLSAPPGSSSSSSSSSSTRGTDAGAAAAAGGGTRERRPLSEEEEHYQTVLLGNHHTNLELSGLFASLQADFAEGARQAYLEVGRAFQAKRDFTSLDFCSPDLSSFLNDVRQSYARSNVEPALTVHKVEARLVALRFEHGLLCKNSYWMGMMGGREAWYNFLVGVAGPEAALIHELNNEDFPRRLTAEVEFAVHERFSLIDRGTGRVRSPQEAAEEEQGTMTTTKHYWTFESDYSIKGSDFDWSVTNINDAIKSPSLSSLMMLSA